MISVLMTNFLQGGPYEFADVVQKAFGNGIQKHVRIIENLPCYITGQEQRHSVLTTNISALLLILSF